MTQHKPEVFSGNRIYIFKVRHFLEPLT